MSDNIGFGNRTTLKPIIDTSDNNKSKIPKDKIISISELTFRRMKGLSGRSFNVASYDELINFLLDEYDNKNTGYNHLNRY